MNAVYLETTIPSYLAARPSRDLVVAAHQQITSEWWSLAPGRFDLFISEAVLAEIRAGDPEAVARRLEIVESLPVLPFNDDVRHLARVYEKALGLPANARVDVLHIAFASAYELDFLVTWNCAHLANGAVIRRLHGLHEEMKRTTPAIITPEELIVWPGGD